MFRKPTVVLIHGQMVDIACAEDGLESVRISRRDDGSFTVTCLEPDITVISYQEMEEAKKESADNITSN